MQRVRGIGGVFFKARDREALAAWYRDCLGLPVQDWGGACFWWRENDPGDAYSVWTPFAADTQYFAPSEASFMVNFRVDDLDAMLAQLRERGVTVDDRIEDSQFGRFGWAMDPEGNRIELWEASPARRDGPEVAVFFYGSYMNRSVLAEVDLAPRRWEVARLDGFDIDIRPRANLVRAPGSSVWGMLASATHAQLDRLYAHARDVLGARYLPEAVLVERRAGGAEPALCYLCHDMQPGPADAAYVDRIVAPAHEHDFPAEYVARLEQFRPAPS